MKNYFRQTLYNKLVDFVPFATMADSDIDGTVNADV